jgi:hypothetical protein
MKETIKMMLMGVGTHDVDKVVAFTSFVTLGKSRL